MTPMRPQPHPPTPRLKSPLFAFRLPQFFSKDHTQHLSPEPGSYNAMQAAIGSGTPHRLPFEPGLAVSERMSP